MEPDRSLYSRQKVRELAGLDDTTINYWSREGLIIPTEGGAGRGSHRQFDFVQVNIAAILGQLRRFKLSISVMRSLAELLQSAARIGSGRHLHPSNYSSAANLANRLNEFRNGVPVMISKHDQSAPPPPGLRGRAYSDWLMEKRPASTEAEVIGHVLGRGNDYDSVESLISFAEALGPGRETEAEIYAQLVYDILAPGYTDAYSWLLGFGPDDSWRIEFGYEGGKFFDRLDSSSPEDFGPGIFLPVSGIIRNVWQLRTPHEYMRERQAEYIRETLAEAGVVATITPNEHLDDGYRIDAPEADWAVVETVLKNLRYTIRTSDAAESEA